MTPLALILLLAAPPGLLPRKPAPPPGATKGPVLTPDPIPDRPLVPPVIVDGDAPPERESAEDEQPALQGQQVEEPDAEPIARAGPTGEWVFTHQYGWLWMAHDDAYWYAPPTGRGHPHAYVYVPHRGWDWVDAPWVWGIGPRPSFGPSGPWRFGWYRAGYWRTPWRWRYWPGPYRG